MRRLRRSSLLLTLVLVADVARGQAADRLTGPIPEELAAYSEARDRFTSRMGEVHAETRGYVEERYEEEHEAFVAGYDARIETLSALDATQRDLTLERFQRFVERYPEDPRSSHVRFRLADLYYERAQEDFLFAQTDFDRGIDATQAESLEALEALEMMQDPQKDLAQSIAQYEAILRINESLPPEERYERLDGVYLMLAFCYVDANAVQFDINKARDAFRALIENVPESELADRSYQFLGDLHFNDNEFEEAIIEYGRVVAKGPESSYYDESLYKLAWARFKLNEYDEAERVFTEILDLSEKQKAASGRGSLFAPEAARFLAFSFADVSGLEGVPAAEQAEAYFQGIGPREWEHLLYEELADVLHRYVRYDEEIGVYKKLQDDPRWVHHPENPIYQSNVVDLYSKGLSEEEWAQAGQERILLTQRYGEGGDWWNANSNNPEALAAARALIESSLLGVAKEHFVLAQEAAGAGESEEVVVGHYLRAAEKYEEYLTRFPISDDYYDQQWWLANAWTSAQRYGDAEKELARLVASRRYHPYGDGAAYSLMDVRLQVMQQGSGPPDQPCGGCAVFSDGKWTEGGTPSVPVEKRFTSAEGREIEVYELPEDRRAFIEAADALQKLEFKMPDPDDVEPGYPDYGDFYQKNRHRIDYVSAQMQFMHNRFEEARPRLERVIDKYPRTDEASYAAGLMVDTYLAVGDLEMVRKYTKKYSTMALGSTGVVDETFGDTLEGATFKLAEQLSATGDPEEAADAFMSYLAEFPNSQHAADAHHNAAVLYAEAGKRERAAELYEEFVARYPDDERTKTIYFRIAANYEATFELERAVDYYDKLVRRFPDDRNAKAALWNASFLRVGLGDYRAAGEGFKSFAEKFPDDPEAEATYWRASDAYDRLGDDQSLKFYNDYIRKYGISNPEHALEAQWRIAKIYERQGRNRDYERQLARITSTFDDIVAKGGEVGVTGHRYAAAAAFPDLQVAFDDLIDDKLTGNEDKDLAILDEEKGKPAEIQQFGERVDEFVGKYKNFEWASGALYYKARSVLYLAELGLSIQCPKGLKDEECWAYEEVLEESVFPKYYALEEAGKERLLDLIEQARKAKKHSRFIDLAHEDLNRLDPMSHAAVKPELRGGVASESPRELTPLPMEDPKPDEAEAAPEPEPAPAPEPEPEGEDEGTPVEEAPEGEGGEP